MEGEENCQVPEPVKEEVTPANDMCVTTPGTMDYWCQGTRNCVAGYVVDNTCADGGYCCRHYCMEGDLLCEGNLAL